MTKQMKYGEIIELGRHRLMCGDATRYSDVEQLVGGERVKLVLTDPPYGVNSVNEKTGKLGSCGKTYRALQDSENVVQSPNHLRRAELHAILAAELRVDILG